MTGMLVRPVVCPIAIGREAEIAALREQLQRSRRGGGQAVLVSGDAGVGKSRLLDEAAAFAAELGYQVVRAACFETGTTAPYAPFAGCCCPASPPSRPMLSRPRSANPPLCSAR